MCHLVDVRNVAGCLMEVSSIDFAKFCSLLSESGECFKNTHRYFVKESTFLGEICRDDAA
jgi:hypothetical protein